MEVLVNKLLRVNTIHMEFKHQGKEFSNYIWEKFDKRCFNCGKRISIDEMALDHTRPLAYLYRLDEYATCLCSTCNSKKRDHFPVEFYSNQQLEELSQKTGLPIDILRSKSINQPALHQLEEDVEWFFDEFLMDSDYQELNDNRLVADKIYEALKRVIGDQTDLCKLYVVRTGHTPRSITSTTI